MAAIPPRDKVDKRQTWNAESVFPDRKAWEEELRSILADLDTIRRYQGRLGENPAILLEALGAHDGLLARSLRVYSYAGFASAVDTTDQSASDMQGRTDGMYGQVLAATAFLRPELLAIGKARLDEWMAGDPKLEIYAHYFNDLFRRQAHVRSGEVEEVLGMLGDPFGSISNTASLLTNADFKFAPAVSSKGKKLEVTQGSLLQILHEPDRPSRRSAWEHYMDRHVEFKNTLAANLNASIRANVFSMRARKHESSLAASLFDNNIPVDVFHNLVETFKKHLPVWHRYFELRRKALGQRDIAYYDMWATLAPRKIKLSFEESVDLICEGLAPMGQGYVAILRKGCLEDRWVDWVRNQGKQKGAFSYGAPGTYPFIMMSFNNNISSMSTLAHELGHSMHSYLTWQNQPFVYSDYSMFVAEVASNFHQAMVRAHLLNTRTDANFQIGLIEEAMSNFFRYFFQMPTLARFELEAHQRIENGESLTADSLIDLMADLFTEGFGPGVKVDRPRVGMVWATFGHLYTDYYVYQYATGISGAHALSNRILRSEPNAVDDYLAFLKAGSSIYPLEALKRAGVDLTGPKPVENTFAVMEDYVNRLEELLG